MNEGQIKVVSLLGNFSDYNNLLKDNPNMTPQEIWDLYKNLPKELETTDFTGIAVHTVVTQIVRHPNLSPEQVLYFLTIPKFKMLAMRHHNFPQEVLDNLVQEKIKESNLKELEYICSNPNIDPKFLDDMVKLPIFFDFYRNIFKTICLKAYNENHFEAIDLMPLNNILKYNLLSNFNVPTRVLDTLAKDFFHERVVYYNPNISESVKQEGKLFLKTTIPYLYKTFLKDGVIHE